MASQGFSLSVCQSPVSLLSGSSLVSNSKGQIFLFFSFSLFFPISVFLLHECVFYTDKGLVRLGNSHGQASLSRGITLLNSQTFSGILRDSTRLRSLSWPSSPVMPLSTVILHNTPRHHIQHY